jgi:hypothetical protein
MSVTVDLRPGFSWSYSKLKNFETCPKRYYHYDVVEDIGEPESAELLFGNQMHAAYAKRCANNTPLPPTFASAEGIISKLLAAPGKKYVEQKWAITSTFQHTQWRSQDAWYRGVADFGKHNTDTATMVVVDWKSGKVKDDLTQLQLMAATVFIHFPTVQRVKAILAFTQYDHVEPATFTRSDQKEIWSEILPRVKELRKAHDEQSFPPKPSFLCRKYCGVVSCPHHGK